MGGGSVRLKWSIRNVYQPTTSWSGRRLIVLSMRASSDSNWISSRDLACSRASLKRVLLVCARVEVQWCRNVGLASLGGGGMNRLNDFGVEPRSSWLDSHSTSSNEETDSWHWVSRMS